MQIYQEIIAAKNEGVRLLAVLLDPDKLTVKEVSNIVAAIENSEATHIFIGGSIVPNGKTERIVNSVKKHTSLPVLIFPGNAEQITNDADGLLYLSLLSGRNPEFLIEQQIKAVPYLLASSLEVIPTGYVLIEGGVETAVQRVSKTAPIPQNQITEIVNTAMAGQYLGKQMIYLEAGSGALHPVDVSIIKAVTDTVSIPVIVGGGIRSAAQLEKAYNAGANLVVIGTAFENDVTFFEKK